MDTFPTAISSYVSTMLIDEKAAVYFLLDNRGMVTDAGGALGTYCTSASPIGKGITDLFIFMEGILPLSEPGVRLSKVNLSSAHTVDARIFKIDAGYGLLLLDDSYAEQMLAPLQQKANELALFREEQTTRMESCLRGTTPGRLSEVDLFCPPNEIDGSVLCVGIYGLFEKSNTSDANKAFFAFKEVLFAVTDPIHKQGGIVESATGSYVLSFFGMFSSQCPTAIQSLTAVQKILKNIEDSNRKFWGQKKGSAKCCYGIASGRFAILTDKGARSPSLYAVGECLHAAMEMEKRVPPGQIMVDVPTYNAAGAYQPYFNAVQQKTLDGTGMSKVFLGNFSHV